MLNGEVGIWIETPGYIDLGFVRGICNCLNEIRISADVGSIETGTGSQKRIKAP